MPRAACVECRPVLLDRWGPRPHDPATGPPPPGEVVGIGERSLQADRVEGTIRAQVGLTQLSVEEPDLPLETVDGAGHSIQGDRPVELSALIDDFVFGGA